MPDSTTDRLLQRRKRYGIDRSRHGRHGALLALAAKLPAPILAERIGILKGGLRTRPGWPA